MKIGGKNGLTKNQFRNLILNLQEIAHEMRDSKAEHDREVENFNAETIAREVEEGVYNDWKS